MPTTTTTTADDLAFLRALAESGRNTPLACGAPILAAGIVFSLTSLAAWGMTLAPQHFASNAVTWLWLAAGLAYTLVLVVMKRNRVALDGVATTVNRAVNSVWTGLGWGVAVMFACVWIVSARFGQPVIWAAFPSIVLALYGAAWTATAFVAGQRWLHGITVAAMLAALICAATTGLTSTFLIYAGLLVAVLVVPGVMLVRGQAR